MLLHNDKEQWRGSSTGQCCLSQEGCHDIARRVPCQLARTRESSAHRHLSMYDCGAPSYHVFLPICKHHSTPT